MTLGATRRGGRLVAAATALARLSYLRRLNIKSSRDFISTLAGFQLSFSTDGFNARFERLGVDHAPWHSVASRGCIAGIVSLEANIYISTRSGVSPSILIALENVDKKHIRGDRIRTCDFVVPNHAL